MVEINDADQIRIINLLLTQLVKVPKLIITINDLIVDAEDAVLIFEKIN